jgi:IclR family acetate operon transcriptional repressor
MSRPNAPAASAAEPSSAAALRAVAIMEAVARSERPLVLSEIATACGLPAPTTFRILNLLEGAGLIQREPNGKTYGVGHRMARFGLDVLTNNGARAERRAILRRVVDEIGETCNLAMQNGDELVYIDRVETDWALKAELKPGSRVPLHCTSSGKLFLAQLPKARRRKMLEALSLKRYTVNTVTDVNLLEAQIDNIAQTDVGFNNEELQGRRDRRRRAGARWRRTHDRQRCPAGAGGPPATGAGHGIRAQPASRRRRDRDDLRGRRRPAFAVVPAPTFKCRRSVALSCLYLASTHPHPPAPRPRSPRWR